MDFEKLKKQYEELEDKYNAAIKKIKSIEAAYNTAKYRCNILEKQIEYYGLIPATTIIDREERFA